MSSYTIPNVIAQHSRGERIMDVYSHLLTERIVYLGTGIDPGVANTLIAQLLHLEAESQDLEINLYINCEGGDLPSMLAVYDTMQYIQAPVATTCVGQAIGVGAVLLAAGTVGRRALLRRPDDRGGGADHDAGDDDGGGAAEILGRAGHQVGDGDVEGARKGRDHLARRLLAAALDLRQVLGRDPRPLGSLRERLVPVGAQRPQAAPEHLPPQWFQCLGFQCLGFQRLAAEREDPADLAHDLTVGTRGWKGNLRSPAADSRAPARRRRWRPYGAGR